MIPCVLFICLFDSHAMYRKCMERYTSKQHCHYLWDYSKERNKNGESISHYPNSEEMANSNQNNLKGVYL